MGEVRVVAVDARHLAVAEAQRAAAADLAAEQLQRRAEDRVDVDRAGGAVLGPGEHPHVADDLAQALGAGHRLAQLLDLGAAAEPPLGVLDVEDQRRERVVELVREAGREHADGGDPLGHRGERGRAGRLAEGPLDDDGEAGELAGGDELAGAELEPRDRLGLVGRVAEHDQRRGLAGPAQGADDVREAERGRRRDHA